MRINTTTTLPMNRHYNRIMNGTLIEGPPGYKRKGMKLGITGMNIYPAMKKKKTNNKMFQQVC